MSRVEIIRGDVAARLFLGDCFAWQGQVDAGSIDLILCDPPYGTVEGIGSTAGVEHGMKGKADWDVALDPVRLHGACERALRANGVAVLFSQEPYSSRLITSAIPNLPFCYRMAWIKDHFANALTAKKAPLSYFEDAIVFAKKHTKHDFAGEHPLRPYAKQVAQHIGRSIKQVTADLGHQRADHFFTFATTQFALCTEATYAELTDRYGLRTMPGFREFAELRAVNATYRAELVQRMTTEAPKVFNLPEGQHFKSNVLQFRKDYDGLHPTQKPVALLEDLLRTYSNAGDTVLDLTMGSGSTGVACFNTGRNFVGIERDPDYFRIAQGCMGATEIVEDLERPSKQASAAQRDMFAM